MAVRILTVLSLLLASCSILRALNFCLYNREEYIPCSDVLNEGVLSPNTNQYTVHSTSLHRISNDIVCAKRKAGEILLNIEDLGSPQVKFLFSPGAEQVPEMNYVSQILVEYNVQCELQQTAFVQFDKLDLEPKNCVDGSVTKCQDYIEIDAGVEGVREFCGNDLPSQPFIVGTGKFTLKFRTSFFDNFPGFRIFVTCFNGNEAIDRSSCTNTGGPLAKRESVFELVDLAAPAEQDVRLQPDAGIVAPVDSRLTPTKFTLTSSDIKTIRSLSRSLFEVALSQARRKLPPWPPASYLRDAPNDITDLTELDQPGRLQSVTLTPLITLPPPPPPSLPSDIFLLIEQPDYISPALQRRRRKRVSLTSGGSLATLDTRSTLEAVRYEEACNVIVRSVTNSYLTIAQRLEPKQLSTARQTFQQELDRAREDLALASNPDLNPQPLQLQR